FRNIIERCWSTIPTERPYAEEVVKMIQGLDETKRCFNECLKNYDTDELFESDPEQKSDPSKIEYIAPLTKKITISLNDLINYDKAEGYFYGRGMPRDYIKAKEYYELVANKGFPLAQN